mgnify:CR=1 FL=1
MPAFLYLFLQCFMGGGQFDGGYRLIQAGQWGVKMCPSVTRGWRVSTRISDLPL